MIIGVNGPKGPGATEKAKAKPKAGNAGGTSFAQLLDEASGAREVGNAAGVGVGVSAGFIPLEEAPRDARGQARELMKSLKELAEDALSGSPTAAVGRLEALAGGMDESGLNASQKQALDEVRTRAAVEVAKLKG